MFAALRAWFADRSWGDFIITAQDGIPKQVDPGETMRTAEQVNVWLRRRGSHFINPQEQDTS